MKKFLSILFSIMLIFSLAACGAPEVNTPTAPESSIESTETTPDLNAEARALLEEKLGNDEEAIEIILKNVPDIFMLKDIKFACWTYFLEMSDGIEYIITTDYEFNIQSISYWNSDVGTSGPVIFEIEK
jgi:predicted small lipoprotein YifL